MANLFYAQCKESFTQNTLNIHSMRNCVNILIAGEDTLINSLKRGFCSQSILGNKFTSERIALF